jgi:hypothetical protein
VLVILLVARKAVLAGQFEHDPFMAGVAFGLRMLSGKWELRFIVVKLDLFLPAFFVMAVLTFVPKRVLVLVVFDMACIAILRQLYPKQFPGMATGALRQTVFPLQDKLCINVVIELGGLPSFGRVASFTFLTKLAFVAFLVIDLAVTGDTGAWSLLVDRILMALGAFRVNVLSGKREFRLLMVKFRLLP